MYLQRLSCVIINYYRYLIFILEEEIQLQERLLSGKYCDLTPEESFLEAFARLVGSTSRWEFLARVLSLMESQMEQVKHGGPFHSGHEAAYSVLQKWASRKDATYSQLREKLENSSLFLH